MRKRYSSKRMRGLRRRAKKRSILPHIDHSGKGLQFARSIAKATSRRGYTSAVMVQSNHINPEGAVLSGNPPQLNANSMNTFGQVWEFASNASSQTAYFIPFHCLNGFGATDQDFMRHANMYTQFRIKCIRFEFVPTTSVTKGTVMPITSAFPAAVITDSVKESMDVNQVNSSTIWLIKWPNKKTGQFMDFGANLVNSGYSSISTESALLDPSVVKIPATEKLVLTWKPKVLGYSTTKFRGINTITGANISAQEAYIPVAKKFPWSNIVDNVDPSSNLNPAQVVGNIPEQQAEGGNSNRVNTSSLRMPLSQPLIAMYDTVYNRFISPELFNLTGRWVMHTVFEFRNKRHPDAFISNQFMSEALQLKTGFQPVNNADKTIDINRV